MCDNSNPVYKDPRHGQSRELIYSYDKDGNFEKTVGFHGETDRVILQQAWDHFHERIQLAKDQVLAGKVSPVVYYMEKNLLDPLSLSMLSGISLWRVKRHFKPFIFNRLREKTLLKYTATFNISLDQLKKVE
ncbi:MAG TPA: hypothetical protein PKN12_08250 [Bacteroidales bacterium]|nr:hypothetical protein [Bacteroidales bacterium]HPT09350.1 hypothetical protein [Bacteroidales bacterium]